MGIPPGQIPNTQSEYEHLLSYFKYLVTLTLAAIGFFVAVGSYMFYSNMKDVREDAKEEATRVATSQARARITEAFDDKNINAMILAAAEKKIGTVTDKLIEQQLAEKLRPIQQRISLVGQISEKEMRMRMGFRSGLDELNALIKSTTDPDAVRYGRSTLAIVGQDYDARIQENVKNSGGTAMQMLVGYMMNQHRPQQSWPGNLHDVAQIIHHDSDLNAVGDAFLAFRELTGASVKMFDFGEVEAWCSRNQPKCQNP